MRMSICRRVISIMCLLAVTTATGYAQASKTVTYQGTLTDALGVPVDEEIAITFAIYEMPKAGVPVWSETLTVDIEHGKYSTILGTIVPITLPDSKPYWLGIAYGAEAETEPRIAMTPAMFSPHANGNPDPPCFDNTSRYADCGNGTVTDSVTHLIWLKNANCFGIFTFADATNAAANLQDGACGLSDNSKPGDWRLPTKWEWEATIAQATSLGCTLPYLTNTLGTACYSAGPQPFIDVQADRYWSSSVSETDPNVAWDVFLGHGFLSTCHEEYMYYVWPVRGGQ